MSADVFGVIAPHPPIMVAEVGGADAAVTEESARAMRDAARLLAAYDPDTLVLMSPHAPAFSDAFVIDGSDPTTGSLAQFGDPRVISYAGDPELARRIIERLDEHGIAAVDRETVPAMHAGELDHGALVPLSFLDPAARWPVVEISLSYLPYEQHRELGRQITAAARDLGRKIAFVASGDCSHRLTRQAPAGYSPQAAAFDARLVELIGASDLDGLMDIDRDLIEAAGECGLRSFITMGGVAEPAHARVLHYEGPWGVGYLTAVVNEAAVTPVSGAKGGMAGADESEIVKLARTAIAAYLYDGTTLDPTPLTDPGLPPRAGAFVSLHREGALRGCIGTIVPTRDSLAQEVVHNAIEAATRDPRFPPMTAPELADLEISVDVLHAPEGCDLEDLDPASYGVIVSCGWKRGLLLPDLEGVDTVEQQVDIACRKAGIGAAESIGLERFKVDRYV